MRGGRGAWNNRRPSAFQTRQEQQFFQAGSEVVVCLAYKPEFGIKCPGAFSRVDGFLFSKPKDRGHGPRGEVNGFVCSWRHRAPAAVAA